MDLPLTPEQIRNFFPVFDINPSAAKALNISQAGIGIGRFLHRAGWQPWEEFRCSYKVSHRQFRN